MKYWLTGDVFVLNTSFFFQSYQVHLNEYSRRNLEAEGVKNINSISKAQKTTNV